MDLNPLDFSIWHLLRAKDQVVPLATDTLCLVYRRKMGPASGEINPQVLLLILPPPVSCYYKK
jgi:hypothetical protein